jgi:hypothetical protein
MGLNFHKADPEPRRFVANPGSIALRQRPSGGEIGRRPGTDSGTNRRDQLARLRCGVSGMAIGVVEPGRRTKSF